MYSKAELTAKAHIELIEMAKEMGISKATRMDAQELVYKILDHQAANPDKSAPAPADDDRRPHRQHMKPKLLAESTMKNPELHKSRKQQAPKPAAAPVAKPVEPPVSNLNFQISSLEMPEVPEVPEVMMPSGRPLFLNMEVPAAPAPVSEAPAESQPAAEAKSEAAPQPSKKKRGRPRKNQEKPENEQPATPAPEPQVKEEPKPEPMPEPRPEPRPEP